MTALQYSEYYLVTTTYPGFSGITRQNIKMQKASEIQPISEVFRYSPPEFRPKSGSAQCELHAFFVNNLWLTEQNKSYFIQYNDLIE